MIAITCTFSMSVSFYNPILTPPVVTVVNIAWFLRVDGPANNVIDYIHIFILLSTWQHYLTVWCQKLIAHDKNDLLKKNSKGTFLNMT